uniref:Uncharacterized protein n=1 Tax=Cacopsylla melanoneura TaxID=428564 RepID=A0A8D8RU39_9HEMI
MPNSTPMWRPWDHASGFSSAVCPYSRAFPFTYHPMYLSSSIQASPVRPVPSPGRHSAPLPLQECTPGTNLLRMSGRVYRHAPVSNTEGVGTKGRYYGPGPILSNYAFGQEVPHGERSGRFRRNRFIRRQPADRILSRGWHGR